LGRAVDELGRDESRANGDVDEYYRELSALRQNHVTLEANVARMILQLRAPTAGATVSLTMAQLMVDSGKAAAAWMEAEKRLVTIHEDVRRRERERDDLRFQVSQLKGRLASMSVEQDMQVAKLRENSARLGRERQVLLDETAHRGAQVTQHLQSFPQLRDLWLGETPLNLGPTR
jgi:predicted  nucleic acid-binding Zn-ribbon protein